MRSTFRSHPEKSDRIFQVFFVREKEDRGLLGKCFPLFIQFFEFCGNFRFLFA